MISKLYARSFKSLANLDWLELSPVTILSGINSCGKSSIIQILLLLKQTLSDSNPEVLIKFNGPLIQLGTFNDIVFGHDENSLIEVGLEFNMTRRYRRGFLLKDSMGFKKEIIARFIVKFALNKTGQDVIVKEFMAWFIPKQDEKLFNEQSSDTISFSINRAKNDTYDVRFNNLSAIEASHFFMMSEELLQAKTNLKKEYIVSGVRVNFNSFIPMGFEVSRKKLYKELDLLEEPSKQEEILTHVRLPLSVPLKASLETYLNDLSYIGPLREEPKRYYFYEQGKNLNIGKKGEYAAQILFSEGKKKVSFYDDVFSNTSVNSSLAEAVKYWICDKMKIASRLSVDTLNEVIYEVKLSTSDGQTEVSISNVGFGVSQILPIVVEGLRSSKNSILIFEQPEIHLHPRMQAELADFILTLAMAGQRIIVETHSDHLVNRIKRRLVEGVDNKVSKLIKIYFAINTNKGSELKNISLDEFGCSDYWPEGFFDQADLELKAILGAQFKKTKQRREPID